MMLRPARPDDGEAVALANNRCWKTAYRGVLPDDALDAIGDLDRAELWRRQITDDAAHFVVAVDDGEVVGFVHVDPTPDAQTDHMGAIEALYVHPDHWRSGAGRLLLDCGCRLLADAGCTEGILWTLPGVDATLAFYQSQGWQPDGTVQRHDLVDRPIAATEQMRLRRPLGRDDEVLANRRRWDAQSGWYAEVAATNWDQPAPTWGLFNVPEDRLHAMPDVAGKDVVELGCGTAYVAGWCLQAGARSVVGIDNSPGQLSTAQTVAVERSAALGLVHGDANRLPFADATFDVAMNEYGAAIWCDPHRWIPEAARVLRDGGLLWFLGNSVLQMLTTPDYEGEAGGHQLVRPQRDMHRFTWPDDDGVEYHISHGDRIRLLRRAGFTVLDLIEVYTEADDRTRYHYGDAEWASHWPVEEIWVAERSPRDR